MIVDVNLYWFSLQKLLWGKKWGPSTTLQGTNISPKKMHFEDDFPFPKVGYVSSLEGILKIDVTNYLSEHSPSRELLRS